MQSAPQQSKTDPHIEGLRGYAALTVMLCHMSIGLLAFPRSGGVAVFSSILWLCNGPLAVKVFFVLSGYVIGLSTFNRPYTLSGAGDYLSKRFIRLFPINLFSVILACGLAASVDWQSALGSTFFLSSYIPHGNVYLPPMENDSNLWSLNYEILFYGLFLFIWAWRPRFEVLGAACLVPAILFFRGDSAWLSASCYATGFMFWIAGLALAWLGKEAPRGVRGASLSTLILLVLAPRLHAVQEVLRFLPGAIPYFHGPDIRLYELVQLPVCLLLLTEVSGRTFRSLPLVRAAAYLAFVVEVLWGLHRGTLTPNSANLLCALLVLVSLFTWRVRLPATLFSRAAWFGSVSYALYSTELQIQVYLIPKFKPANFPQAIAWGLVIIGISLALAWYLERRLQPWIKAHYQALLRKRAKTPPAPQVHYAP